jgi:tetratricopeptide (TPR) repeat protein
MTKLRWQLRVSLSMGLVAFIALILAAENWWSRSREYSRLALIYGERENDCKIMEQGCLVMAERGERTESRSGTDSSAAPNRESAESGEHAHLDRAFPESNMEPMSSYRITANKVATMAKYWGELHRRYEYAASHAWIYLEPDPLPLDPSYLADYWTEHQQYSQALTKLERDINRDPSDYGLLAARAWLLATCPDPAFRDGRKAVESAILSRDLAQGNAGAEEFDSLAAAYAECGDFKSAVRYQEEAVDAVRFQASDRKNAYQQRLKLYKAGKPFRQNRGVSSIRGD